MSFGPPGVGGEVPVYRMDEFVRRPTAWTRPMQVAVTTYFGVSILASIATQLLFGNEIRSLAMNQMQASLRRQGQAMSAGQLDQTLSVVMIFSLVLIAVFSLVYVALAILTITGTRTWVFWVDLVILGLGVFGAVSVIASMVDPANSQIPSGMRPISAVQSLADIALVTWMIVGLVKYGPWAQDKAPATFEG